MEHVGIVVDDLAAATEFFVELGLELRGQGPVEGRWVDRVVGLDGVRAEIALLQTPDGHGRLELTKFHSPWPKPADATRARASPRRPASFSRAPAAHYRIGAPAAAGRDAGEEQRRVRMVRR